MNTLKLGSQGSLVVSLQTWFANFEPIAAHGQFDASTEQITRKMQEKFGLKADGVVGPRTTAEFMRQGWFPDGFDRPGEGASAFPPPPAGYRPLQLEEKLAKFGSPGRIPAQPTPGGPLQVDPGFQRQLAKLDLKQWFPKIQGDQVAWVNKQVAGQWRSFFNDIAAKGLTNSIMTCAGSWVPRLVRGSTSAMSSHAFGTALDFNAPENWLGSEPAHAGEKGSLTELLPLLPKYRIYWGGWFARVDGMHFESTATDAELGLT